MGARLWFLWAFSLTTGLSVVAVWLARLRLSLHAHQRAQEDREHGAAEREAQAQAAAANLSTSAADHLSTRNGGAAPQAHQLTACGLLCRGVRRHCGRVNWRGELMSICAVLEATFGWVTGCAWTNYIGAGAAHQWTSNRSQCSLSCHPP